MAEQRHVTPPLARILNGLGAVAIREERGADPHAAFAQHGRLDNALTTKSDFAYGSSGELQSSSFVSAASAMT